MFKIKINLTWSLQENERVGKHSQLIKWGQYYSISNSNKGSTKRKFQPIVSHKFKIKSFHSHTYKSTKWIQLCIKISLDSFWSLPKSGHITYIFKVFKWIKCTDTSFQFSHSVVSESLRPHESQHTRPPCPSQTPGVYTNSCPSSWWCHPAILPLSSPSPPAHNPSQHHS